MLHQRAVSNSVNEQRTLRPDTPPSDANRLLLTVPSLDLPLSKHKAHRKIEHGRRLAHERILLLGRWVRYIGGKLLVVELEVVVVRGVGAKDDALDPLRVV